MAMTKQYTSEARAHDKFMDLDVAPLDSDYPQSPSFPVDLQNKVGTEPILPDSLASYRQSDLVSQGPIYINN